MSDQTPATVGPYRIGPPIGRDGPATIYRAEHSASGRAVALAVLPAGLSADADLIRRMLAEIERAAALRHPNILPIYEAGLADGRLFIAMQLAEGGSLADWLAARDARPWRNVLLWLWQIGTALDTVHQHGLVIGGLTPARIWINDDGQALVSIVSLGGLLRALTLQAHPGWDDSAELDYLAPEIIAGQAPSASSDIYALGRIAQQLLAGPPSSEVLGGSQLPDALSADIAQALGRALASEPGARYANAAALIQALGAAAGLLDMLPRESAREGREPNGGQGLPVGTPPPQDRLPTEPPPEGLQPKGGLLDDLLDRMRGALSGLRGHGDLATAGPPLPSPTELLEAGPPEPIDLTLPLGPSDPSTGEVSPPGPADPNAGDTPDLVEIAEQPVGPPAQPRPVGPPAPDQAGRRVEQARRIDAAIPSPVALGQQTRLLVQVRTPDAPPLGPADFRGRRPEHVEQGGEETTIPFPVDPASGRLLPTLLLIHVETASFDVREPDKLVEVPPDAYSRPVTFLMVARAPGEALIDIEVYTAERHFLGSAYIDTRIGEGEPDTRLARLDLKVQITPEPAGAPTLVAPAPPPLADLEITVERERDSYRATAICTLPDGRTRATLARDAAVALDPTALLAEQSDPATYGRLLTAQLFADESLRGAWRQAAGFAQAGAGGLRLRLHLDDRDEELHTLRWETLRDPADATAPPLALSERLPFSRYLDSPDLTPLALPSRPALRAVVAVAAPINLADLHLDPIDAPAEIALARAALGAVPITVLGGPDAAPRAELGQIEAALRDGAQILYLVCHGRIVDGAAQLLLENAAGQGVRVAGADFVAAIDRLARPPLLVVLASCRSAGAGYGPALAALGPALARAGVPAVLGFQGDVAVATVRQLLPALFSELLHRDGAIDRALATARGSLRDSEWWQPVLWLRSADGQLWG